jgi:L-2-hydroxycarboxylate dehydrogenase (NAD+)
MNLPPEEFVRIPHHDLRQLSAACLKAAGLRPDHADEIAQVLADTDLRGVRSHGVRTTGGYCRQLRKGSVNPNPELSIVRETPTSVLVDGDGGLGYVPMMMAVEAAASRAQEMGLAAGATHHIGHYGAAGNYVRRAMAHGCIAFGVQGHDSDMGQPHADPAQRPQSAYWGNPPMSFGLPGQNGPPLVLDMATCILGDRQRGEEFDALQELIPAAFFKSMGFTGVARALGGIFVGQDNPAAKAVAEQWPAARGGGLIIVLDMNLFTGASEFREGIDQLVRGVSETMAPVRGYDEASLPGTPEHRCEQEYARHGVPMASADVLAFQNMAAEYGVPLPASLQ